MEKEKDINGKVISNAIGFCHCSQHKGSLNKELVYEHKCQGKKCKFLEKYDENQWHLKKSYYNKTSFARC